MYLAELDNFMLLYPRITSLEYCYKTKKAVSLQSKWHCKIENLAAFQFYRYVESSLFSLITNLQATSKNSAKQEKTLKQYFDKVSTLKRKEKEIVDYVDTQERPATPREMLLDFSVE